MCNAKMLAQLTLRGTFLKHSKRNNFDTSHLQIAKASTAENCLWAFIFSFASALSTETQPNLSWEADVSEEIMHWRIVKGSHAFSPAHAPDVLGDGRDCVPASAVQGIRARPPPGEARSRRSHWTVRVSPLHTPLCCAQASSSSPASLISLPHQALIKPCLPSRTWGADPGAGAMPGVPAGLWGRLRQASLPPAGAAAQGTGTRWRWGVFPSPSRQVNPLREYLAANVGSEPKWE